MFTLPLLIFAAIFPIVALCFFIYIKDKNKEPIGLLFLIFFLGLITVFPVVICELVFGLFFPMNVEKSFLSVFFNVFFGVALYEECFKWLVTKFLGYNNKEFDEVYDIIIYAVFASLGFACFENVLYVLQNGFGTAIMRAVSSIPGHTCFAIAMGFFFSKAKVAQINGNKSLYTQNLLLSILVPIVLHTFYDAFLFYTSHTMLSFVFFVVFYIAMVITCFLTVDKVAKVQQNLTTNLKKGTIVRNNQGYLYYNHAVTSPVETSSVTSVPVQMPVSSTQSVSGDSIPSAPTYQALAYCPICGRPTKGGNFCAGCGFHLK